MAMVLLRTTAPVTVGAHVPAGGVDAWNEALQQCFPMCCCVQLARFIWMLLCFDLAVEWMSPWQWRLMLLLCAATDVTAALVCFVLLLLPHCCCNIHGCIWSCNIMQ